MEYWKRGMHAFTGNLKCWYTGNVLETWNACIYWKFEMLVYWKCGMEYWKRGMHAFTGNLKFWYTGNVKWSTGNVECMHLLEI